MSRRRLAAIGPLVPSLLIVLLAGSLAAVIPPGSATKPAVPGADCPAPGAHPSVAAEAAAVALAEACDVPVEVASARGFSKRTWAQPSGTLRSEIYVVPRWTRDEAGEWVAVDPSLVRDGDGSVRPVATVSRIRLSGGGGGPFVAVTDPYGGSLSLTWPAALPEPELAGDTATYPDVLAGVDLSVTAGVDGFSYRLVVHTAAAAANPALARVEVGIATDGLAVSQDANGLVEAVNAAGEPVFTSGPALMWDSSASGRVEQLPLELAEDTLAVVPDATMLADPAVVFPVFIDPPFVGQREAWANVHREQPSRGWTSDGDWPREGGMRVGLCTWTTPIPCADGTGLWRSVVKFDTDPLDGRHILEAAVKMTQTHTGGCGTYPLKLNQVSAFSSSVSWNGVDWRSHLQTRNVASSNIGCGSGNHPVTFNNSNVRSRVQHHADQGYSTISFGVRSGDEGTRNQWRRISRNSLKLEVEHASYPGKPTSLSTDGKVCQTSGPGSWLTTGRPVLSGRPHNEDGNGRYRLRVRTSGGSSDVYSYGSGVVTVNTTVSRQIPSTDALPDGSYRWQMRTESATSGVPASSYSSWCYFRVDTTPPAAPSATQLTADPQLGDPVQFQLNGPPDADRFRYNLTGGPDTTVAASGGAATITVDPPETSIDHQLQVWALDAAGNVSDRYDLWFATGKDLSRLPVAGAWRFDGDWRDDSGNGHELTPGPGVAPSADRLGRAAAAAGFPAAPDGCLSTDNPVLDTSTSFTVAAWARLSDGGGPNPAVVTQAGSYRPAFYLEWHRSSNRWNFSMPSADEEEVTWRHARATQPPTLDQWYHVAGVYDTAAQQIRLYVDGVLQAAVASHPSSWQATGPLVIGCAARISGDTWHVGDLTIDDVVAYQGVLTGERIGQLMTGGPPAGQVSWWPLRGDGNDAGVGGNGLTVPPGVVWVPDSFGRTGSAMQLDGQSCAATAGPVVRTDDSFTVAAWARPDAGGTTMQVVSQAGAGTTPFRLTRGSAGEWSFRLAASDVSAPDWYAVQAPAAVTTGGWQHITGVYDAGAGEIRIYVDGAEQGVAAAPGVLWRGTGGLHVGCAADGAGTADYFDGAVYDVRVWRGAASPEQLLTVATERVSFWGLDGSGTDGWGGHDLSLVGDYEWVDDRFGFPFSAFGLALDGTGWAETAGPVVTTDESFTVSAWAKLEDKSDDRTVVAQAAGTRPSFSLKYHPAPRDRWQFELPAVDAESTTWHTALSSEAPAVGVWYHLAGVFDLGANEVRLYVNGELQEVVTGPATPWHVDGELLVGTAGDTAGQRWSPMVGAVDMVRVYRGVLDERRIADQGVVPVLVAGFAKVQQGDFDTTTAEVPVTLSEPATFPVTVDYESYTPPGPGYAVAPDDFQAVAGTLAFQPGETVKSIPVTVNGDPDQAEDLLAMVALGDPVNATVSGEGEGGVRIMPPPAPTVTPVIDTPTGGEQWRAGEEIAFSGHATDAGGTLPDGVLSWQLRRVECTDGACQSEVLQEWSGVAAGSFQAPDIADPVQLELELVAEDGSGAAGATVVQLEPATVELSFASDPPGLELAVDSDLEVAPVTRTVVVGATLAVAAPTPQQLDESTYTFNGWSDGGAQTHTIEVTAAPASYTASYLGEEAGEACGTGAYGYTCTGGPRPFLPATEVLALAGDEDTAELSLPFPVWLYGQVYERAWVDTNGLVTFLEPEASAGDVSTIPSPYVWGTANAAVYPFWNDWLVDTGASVRTGLSGTAPHRQFVVEWRDVTTWDDATVRVSFQVVFYESGQIGFAWDGIDPVPQEQGAGGVVGIENLDGTEALAYSQFTESLSTGAGALFTPPPPGYVSGVVTDAGSGAPLSDTPVTLNPAGWTTVTDADGGFEFASVPVGEHGVVAHRSDGACAGPEAAELVSLAAAGDVTVDLAVGSGIDGFGNTCTVAPQAFLPTTDELVSFGYYGSEEVTLPFPVTLYGQEYDTAWVDIDGVVNFVEEGPFDNVSPIPSTPDWGKPNAAVYPFWSDWIVSDGASIRTGTTGSAPERQFVIEWRDVWSWDWLAQVSFQVVFHETGEITVAYDGIDPSLQEQGRDGVVGIENADGTDALVYSQFAPALASGQAVLFQPPD